MFLLIAMFSARTTQAQAQAAGAAASPAAAHGPGSSLTRGRHSRPKLRVARARAADSSWLIAMSRTSRCVDFLSVGASSPMLDSSGRSLEACKPCSHQLRLVSERTTTLQSMRIGARQFDPAIAESIWPPDVGFSKIPFSSPGFCNTMLHSRTLRSIPAGQHIGVFFTFASNTRDM